ncbi:hypothetical protein [Rubrivirga marina]|uniref:Outer membrane protein beta-barrel domain-containing protein n=1 Tax=Rubrivirga marina TaxID=1196024 RepID=A0A271J5G5_9BACT|nr:hypothetical protein [Rubrivirga marina]PAP78205.1 hypothetical protein BSZ37_18115 [Rubrivirga marina]
MRLLLLSLVLAVPALAQQAAMDVGPQSLDLTYRPGGVEAPVVAYDGTVTSLGFYGDASAFSGFYGSEDRIAPTGEIQTMTVSGIEMRFGTNVPVASFGERTAVSVFVPLRAQSAYRYFLGDMSVEVQGDDTSIHIGQGDLGTGIGAAVEVPLAAGAPARKLRAFGTYVAGAGIQGDFVMGLPGGARDPLAYGLRSNTVMLQTEARDLFGTTMGASVGYSFRTASTDTSPIESAAGLLNGFTGDDFRRLESSHLVHVGVIF